MIMKKIHQFEVSKIEINLSFIMITFNNSTYTRKSILYSHYSNPEMGTYQAQNPVPWCDKVVSLPRGNNSS